MTFCLLERILEITFYRAPVNQGVLPPDKLIRSHRPHWGDCTSGIKRLTGLRQISLASHIFRVWFSGFQNQLSISIIPFRPTQIIVLAVRKAQKNDCIVVKVFFWKGNCLVCWFFSKFGPQSQNISKWHKANSLLSCTVHVWVFSKLETHGPKYPLRILI